MSLHVRPERYCSLSSVVALASILLGTRDYGNCQHYGLKVAGRRNDLGVLLNIRKDQWFSGTAPGFAAIFRDNTHTAPNCRIPLSAETHDVDCTADCLTKCSLTRMIAAAQRAQRSSGSHFLWTVHKESQFQEFWRCWRGAGRSRWSPPL